MEGKPKTRSNVVRIGLLSFLLHLPTYLWTDWNSANWKIVDNAPIDSFSR